MLFQSSRLAIASGQKRLLLAGLVAAVLAGCGGGGGTADPSSVLAGSSASVTGATQPATDASDVTTPAPGAPLPGPTSPITTAPVPTAPGTATPPASPAQIVVDYYGDSTIWGYRSGAGGQVATPAPSALAAALASAPTRYIVRNEGVNASTACDLLNGTDGRHPRWQQQLAGSDANVVVVNHAINDEWKLQPDEYKSCLRGLATQARQAGKKILFETPNPTRDSYPAGLDTWAQMMRDVASELQVPVIDQYAYLKSWLAGRSPLEICPDGLHPTQEVYVMKGQYAARILPDLIR